jgi:high-affinity iron transporter
MIGSNIHLNVAEVNVLPSFLLSLREGLEAALIIGIVLGALRKLNRPELRPVVWWGAGIAALLSMLTAFALIRFGASLEGAAEEIFEGITMLLAAGVLTWMIFWMQRQSRTIKSDLEADVRRAASGLGKQGLFLLAFFAVLREGVELALFLTATAMAFEAQANLWGAVLGLGAAAFLGWAIYTSTLRLNLRGFFMVTSILLILFAGGLVAHAVHEFNEVGWIPAVVEHVWDTNAIIDEASTAGTLLTALFGYNGNPSLTEVLAYVSYFVVIFISLRLSSSAAPATQKAGST